MAYDKAEDNLAKISIFNPKSRCAVLPRINHVGQPVTRIEINIYGQRDDPPNQEYHMEPEHGKTSKTDKKTANPTPFKSSGAGASIADPKRYPDESRSEKNCFGTLNKNTHIA